MKNKGFTLIELMGVIIILGIIGTVIIPKVGDSIENSKNQAFIAQEEQIKKAAYDFMIDNTELLEGTNTITIKLETLKQGGYLPLNIKNPKTKKTFSNESQITITKSNNKYNIELTLIDLEDMVEIVENGSPIIILNGDYIEYVEVNEIYKEKGAQAKSSTGEILNNISILKKYQNREISEIQTTSLNTYDIIYSTTDNGKTTTATRTVIVRDTIPPIITLPVETNLTTKQVAGYNLMDGVIINDNYDENVTTTIDSSLSNLPGKYVITYEAIDHSGNKTTERRIINVK